MLGVLPDGTLVKDQSWPRREISEVGERFLSVRRGPDAEANVLPIPSAMRPALRVLRLLVASDLRSAGSAFEMGLGTDDAGWEVTLTPTLPEARGIRIMLLGCGNQLRRVKILEAGAIERHYTFDPE